MPAHSPGARVIKELVLTCSPACQTPASTVTAFRKELDRILVSAFFFYIKSSLQNCQSLKAWPHFFFSLFEALLTVKLFFAKFSAITGCETLLPEEQRIFCC